MEVHDNLRVRMARPKRFSWVKFFMLLILVVLLIGGALYAYATLALKPMATAEKNVQTIVKQQTDLTNLHDLTVDYRDGATYAVLGQTPSGQQKVAIIQGKKGSVQTFNYGNGISKSDLLDKIKSKYQLKKIYSANLSIYQKTLVWEISFEDQNGHLNYVTMDYRTGAVYRTINGI